MVEMFVENAKVEMFTEVSWGARTCL